MLGGARKIHMVGIGGIGMSALAFVLSGMGRKISGSDLEENGIIRRLRKKGISVTVPHDTGTINDQDIVVYSSSIRRGNPELVEARKRKIPIIPRSTLLKKVMSEKKKVIAVTGTHGKTTTTAMSSFLLEKAGFDPTVLIGGESPHFGGNAKLGKSHTIVTEVDESDGRFVDLRTTHLIMPNLEREHLEHYRNEAHLLATFKKFIKAQPKKTVFFYRIEDKNLKKLARCWRGRRVTFGFSKKADFRAGSLKATPFGIEFECFRQKQKLGRFRLNIPGVHNAVNALSVISLGVELGIRTEKIKKALAAYKGVKRRFEWLGEARGINVVEDYAHHPTEIKATISAAVSLKPKRLITVFQPHRYTRTRSFYREFSRSFGGSTEVILSEVYPASEDKIEGAGTKRIYDIMAGNGFIPVKFMDKAEIPKYLARKAKKGDLVLVLGAGDIEKTAREVLRQLKK